ncbi:MAG: molybdopterin cofactor-binding domain-containing protein, partial [Planctomycetota bacterium]
MSSVGKAIPHDSAVGHVTGAAPYIEDLPPLSGELWVDFAGAPVAAGRLLSFDASEALELPGVVAVFSHRDVDGENIFGPIFHDEVFLIDDEIAYLGQPVVVVAATSRTIARQAARMIKIECKAAEPILSVEDAIEAGAYLGPVRKIQRGEVEVGFDQSEHIIEGTFRNNGQEQFYLESQACQAIPNEIDQLKLISSTQNPTETQAVVAEVLGLH